MNIDIPTLRVLVAPHVIHGSRFFADTRLRPPQLVAYIQLDNRAAAQDVRPNLLPTPITPQDKLKLKLKNPKLAAMYQDIYAAPQAPQQQDTNNVGGGGNVHNATGARRGYPNTNVNANRNGVGGGGYQSQIQSSEGVVGGGGVEGLGRMSMDTTQLTPGTGSATVPPPLQPISATLSQLQMQLESLRPLLAAYTNSNNANTTSDTTSNGTTTNNGINTNLHSHNAQSQSHSNPTSPHVQSVPIPNSNSHPNFAAHRR
ncbi:hypothetical protein M422DRAFT_258469 [Sphaerobolus stellatus SS14]|uniref:Uncharacterized protein n=1 Tax=Sphaerobolus stellatus (strain SS14) TaxID=990650 RepID=A0A0C9VMA8_SPHS4|nr:hypothetical protein M422DRAFT_258469 [Sphaerobolus stellatus SS14]